MPFRIAVVCLGNICRSPMAAAVLRHKIAEAGLSDEVVVNSAGTGDWHVGSGADRRARAALRSRGYSDEHRAQQFLSAHFADHDLVLGMDAANVRDLRRIAPDPQIGAAVRLFDIGAEVPDPYYGGPEDFEAVLDQIERAADALLAELPQLMRSDGGS
jgi:protein-tyrosine phosphatase